MPGRNRCAQHPHGWTRRSASAVSDLLDYCAVAGRSMPPVDAFARDAARRTPGGADFLIAGFLALPRWSRDYLEPEWAAAARAGQ